MKDLLRKIQAALTATAFAEEGEVETATRIMADAGMGRRTARRRGATLRLVPPPPPAVRRNPPAEESPDSPSPRHRILR
jgi:hypothetical protein